MSSKRSITDKAMFALQVTTPAQSQLSPSATRIRTGPGALVAHLAAESDAMKENEALRAELKVFDGASPSKKISPALIEPSKWANRHSDSFTVEAFAQLKAEIASAGGNVQPIKVRPVTSASGERYEIVFGHRRHRACLELGLPVLCIVESITDQALFQEMERENRNRADLRPYEQGEMYRHALDEGLFASLRALAEAIGAQPGHVSTALQIARLPEQILNAFPSRLDIQYRWSKPLTDLLKTEPELAFSRAQGLIEEAKKGVTFTGAEVFARLTEVAVQGAVDRKEIQVAGAVVASIRQSAGRVTIEFEKGVLPKEKLARLEKSIAQLFS